MKIFEDSFSDILTDIVNLALEYCNKSVDEIYIHCSIESNCISSNVFFKKDGKKIKRSQIRERKELEQIQLIHSINVKLEDLEKLFVCNNQTVPTEVKLVYVVFSHKLKSDFCYENLYTGKEDIVVQDIFDRWYESV